MKEIEAHLSKIFLAREGVSPEALQARLRSVGNGFIDALGRVDEAAFYTAAPGKWTPAQLADHVVRANGLFAKSLERVYDGKAVLVMPRGKVTDDGRAIAPGEEEPVGDRMRADLVQDFQAGLVRLEAAGERVATAQLIENVCLDQSFFGPMTGLEVLQLSTWHIRHHTKQLPGYKKS